MTREEAIKSLKALRGSINGVFDYNCRNQCNALDMAIKALEQQVRIIQILDDYDLEAWEILEMIKEVVRV